MAHDNDPSVLPQLPPPTTRSTLATSVDGHPTRRRCRRLALITDVSAGTAMDVCASPIDGRRVVHAFLSAGPVVEVRLLRDTLGPLAAGSDATYGRYFMLGYNGNFHLRQTGLEDENRCVVIRHNDLLLICVNFNQTDLNCHIFFVVEDARTSATVRHHKLCLIIPKLLIQYILSLTKSSSRFFASLTQTIPLIRSQIM